MRPAGLVAELILARDHFGIKPLYYCERGGRLAFASEIKALLEVPGIEARISMEALDQYLTFLWAPDPLTMFEGIRKLPGGHYAFWQGRRVEDRTVLGPDVSSGRNTIALNERKQIWPTKFESDFALR